MTGIDEDDYSLFSEVHALYMYSVHTYTHSTNLLGKQYKETKQTYLLLFLYTECPRKQYRKYLQLFSKFVWNFERIYDFKKFSSRVTKEPR